MQDTPEVAIIGAGPIGSLIAEKLSKHGIYPIVFEEHKTIGQPDHCAGLVNKHNLEKLYTYPQKVVLNKIKGAIIRFGNNNFTLYRKKNEAVVINRSSFDYEIANNALKKGAVIKYNTRVRSYKYDGNQLKIFLNNTNTPITSSFLVNAAGVQGLLSKKLNKIKSYHGLKYAVQYEVENVKDIEKEFVELYFDNNLTPGFFSWIIPMNESEVRIGLASNDNLGRTRLNWFMGKKNFNKHRFKHAKILRIKAGIVLTGGPIKKTYARRVLFVGDAAGQVKPTTGGGIITGGICAKIAAQVIKQMLMNENSSTSESDYQKRWRSILGREFTYMKYARNVLDGITNADLIKLFTFIKEEWIAKGVSSIADMDFQAKSISTLLFNKKIIRLIPIILKGLINSFIN
ncbi:MAG: geranylgeranyl reductase family protein [Candidatus Odinarchaeia archaeon]